MKITILLLLAVAFGWFIHSALVVAAEQIYDWKDDARWAVFAALDIAAILILF